MHDLLVIGAGPAGATCARRAAEKGLDVILLEKETHPRTKPCGGALSLRATNLLNFDISKAIEKKFQAAVIHTSTGKTAVLTCEGFESYLVKRSAFDHLLLERAKRAGAEVIQGTNIVAIEQLRKGIRALSLGDSYKAHLLVGADGVNGITGAQLGIRNRWDSKSVATCINAEFPANSSDIARASTLEGREETVISFYYGLVDKGYGWCFPKNESLNIGLGCRMDSAMSLRNKWEVLVSQIEQSKKIKLQVANKSSARVPLGGEAGLVARRAMLIGDAAGLVSPVSGEGISYAIESGILAADVAEEAVAEKSPARIMDYQWKLNHGMIRELRILRVIAGILYRTKSNIDILCAIIKQDSQMSQHLIELFSRNKPYPLILSQILRRMLLYHPLKSIKLSLL